MENRNQFVAEIIDIFEGFLERRDITLDNKEKDDAILNDESTVDEIGNIYGSDYGELETDIEDLLDVYNIMVQPIEDSTSKDGDNNE